MLLYVHHVHYLVHDLDAMMIYLEKNFGMKPDHLVEYKFGMKPDHVGEHKDRAMKESIYDIGKTHIQITEPRDPKSGMGKHLAKHGPGVYHVAWAVDDIRKVVKELIVSGNKLRDKDGIYRSPRGYLTCNIDPASSHGLVFQLAEGTHVSNPNLAD